MYVTYVTLGYAKICYYEWILNIFFNLVIFTYENNAVTLLYKPCWSLILCHNFLFRAIHMSYTTECSTTTKGTSHMYGGSNWQLTTLGC